jgi:hypothetical protein
MENTLKVLSRMIWSKAQESFTAGMGELSKVSGDRTI